MVKITGWAGKIPPIGSFYPRYTNTGKVEFRNTNTGELREGIKTSTGYKLGSTKGYELNRKHTYGHDGRAPKKNIGNIPKLKAMKLKRMI